jgi:hypothetical protein
MKTKLTFYFEEGEDPTVYIDPLKPLAAIHDLLTTYRELDKYGHDYKSADEAVRGMRALAYSHFDDIPEDWKP